MDCHHLYWLKLLLQEQWLKMFLFNDIVLIKTVYRVRMVSEYEVVDWMRIGTKVFRKTLPWWCFVHTNSTWSDLESNLGYSDDFKMLAYISTNMRCFEHFLLSALCIISSVCWKLLGTFYQNILTVCLKMYGYRLGVASSGMLVIFIKIIFLK